MVFAGESPKGFPSGILRIARRKLKMVDAAVVLADLRAPPGNQLEALTGDRRGRHSIRINDQWRICLYGPQKDRSALKSLIITKRIGCRSKRD